jgi:IS5 family transposase
MGERRGVYRVLVGKPEGKRPHRRPGVDGRIILRWIFRKWDVVHRTGGEHL